MAMTEQDWPISEVVGAFDADFAPGSESETVSKEARKTRVLAFLVDTRLALPTKVLFRNLSYRGADFKESTLKNYLGELEEEGFVARIDAEKFSEGQVVRSEKDPGYWVSTNEGVEHIEALRNSTSDDIDTSHL